MRISESSSCVKNGSIVWPTLSQILLAGEHITLVSKTEAQKTDTDSRFYLLLMRKWYCFLLLVHFLKKVVKNAFNKYSDTMFLAELGNSRVLVMGQPQDVAYQGNL